MNNHLRELRERMGWSQAALAERLAVSRQPVLQALRLLKQEGLLHDAPGRGLQVAPLEPAALHRVPAGHAGGRRAAAARHRAAAGAARRAP